MHPKLLFDVIQRQAGTLGKAVLEGVMNSVDAKATECRVTLGRDSLTILDNGQGFRNRSEIEDWFEVFGQPHDEAEEKVYGNFRMGRGQLFAFGKNHWNSNVFHMDVDIKNKGLDYILTQNGKVTKGCQVSVSLYEELNRAEEDTIIREIKTYCKYAPIPVYLNDELISTDPETEKWDYVTDDAYIRIKPTGGLSVYHLGVYIQEHGGYRFGVGGTIVAKQQLMLNFARNDILVSKCKVWKRIEAKFRGIADDVIKNKPLNESGRARMATRLLAGDLSTDEIRYAKIITATTGRQYSLNQLRFSGRYSDKVSVAPRGDMWGDRAMKQGLAFVVAEETLDRFGVTSLRDLWTLLHAAFEPLSRAWQVCGMDGIFADRDSSWTPLTDKELTPREKSWLKILNNLSYTINDALMRKQRTGDWRVDRATYVKARTVGIGVSPCSLAWTDGSSYVYFGREFGREYLAEHDFNLQGLMEIAGTMLHEYCHNEPDSETHTHSQEFYEKFHDNFDTAHAAVAYAFSKLEYWLSLEDKKLTKKLLKERDRYEGILKQKALFKLSDDALAAEGG
jgi:hypothetical protein